MIKTTLSILALAGACIFLTNCATLFNLEKPEVNLQRVFVRDTSLSGTTLIFVVKVDNPNKQEIKVKEIAYKVFISGKELTQAKTQQKINQIKRNCIQLFYWGKTPHPSKTPKTRHSTRQWKFRSRTSAAD
jgi:LEA14-like dessication related protein